MKLSTIIPAYRRHPLTVAHVRFCMLSSRPPDEIIVVNDGGDPCLRDMLIAMPRTCKIIYARIEQDILWNYNGAVNLGFWLATGDYVAIEDTDHIPDKDVYKKTLELAREYKDVDRFCFRRKCVDIFELGHDMNEWKFTKVWGANQMVTVMKRQAYIRLKGQDEQFGGHYGYMCYDWKNRYNNILKIKSMGVPAYYYAILDGGEPGMKRGMSYENHKLYKENARRGHPQHPAGILNFTYTYEEL